MLTKTNPKSAVTTAPKLALRKAPGCRIKVSAA